MPINSLLRKFLHTVLMLLTTEPPDRFDITLITKLHNYHVDKPPTGSEAQMAAVGE